jgi:hypothetical protein
MTAPTLLFRDTPRTRRTDPLESHAAADTNNVAASQLTVLDLLAEYGAMADHEMVTKSAEFTPQRLRTARHELTEMGLTEATGYFRLTASGRKANVWQVTA